MPTLLAFIPHPDDEAYSFGGTIALAARLGWRCLVECASSGEKGRVDGQPAPPESVRVIREGELRASCAALGAAPPDFWRLPDGGLGAVDGDLEVARAVQRYRPDLVLALGADGAYGHPDHLAVYRWVRAAWPALGGERPALLFAAFPRGLFLPQYQKCLAMMGEPPDPPASAIGSATSEYEVPIAPVAAQKRAAIAAHRSQLAGGDPESLFPPGIVAALMPTERFSDPYGRRQEVIAALLGSLASAG